MRVFLVLLACVFGLALCGPAILIFSMDDESAVELTKARQREKMEQEWNKVGFRR
jgi:hypothetical protein